MKKRNTTAALVACSALLGAVGVGVLTHDARATRSVGMDAGQIGSVDVFALIDRALSTEEMLSARQDYETKTNAALEQLQQQFVELQNQLSTMKADDPNAQALYGQYQTLQNQLQMQSQQASLGYQTLIAEQIAEAYQEIYEAANAVGAEQGYAFVFATRSDGELLQTTTITGVTQEILARPLVTPPAATDLTEAVRVRLGYPEKPLNIDALNNAEGEGDSGDAGAADTDEE